MKPDHPFRLRFTAIIVIILVIVVAFQISACQNSLPPADLNQFEVTVTPGSLYTEFPDEIFPNASYLIYLHGKIIEDQGLPAISPEFGEYQYQDILEEFQNSGFVVISEQRPLNADVYEYAEKIKGQILSLLNAGVPASQITLVGASKGAGIVIYASHLLNNPEIRYVLLAICSPDHVKQLIRDQIYLTGKVLSIYDSDDRYAGSCQDLFEFSADRGLSRYDEIHLSLGLGHGLLYQPLEGWIQPTLNWALGNNPSN